MSPEAAREEEYGCVAAEQDLVLVVWVACAAIEQPWRKLTVEAKAAPHSPVGRCPCPKGKWA